MKSRQPVRAEVAEVGCSDKRWQRQLATSHPLSRPMPKRGRVMSIQRQSGKVQNLREMVGQDADRFLLVAVRLWPFNCPSD